METIQAKLAKLAKPAKDLVEALVRRSLQANKRHALEVNDNKLLELYEEVYKTVMHAIETYKNDPQGMRKFFEEQINYAPAAVSQPRHSFQTYQTDKDLLDVRVKK